MINKAAEAPRPRRFRVGVQLQGIHTSLDRLRAAWRAADRAGFDSLWLADHFVPWTGDPGGTCFEAWSLLGAMAIETKSATIGTLVSSQSYRNPDLLADMARTIDHLSGGRAAIGIGAGWYAPDYEAYGYPMPPGRERVQELDLALARIRRRLELLNPQPIGRLPLLVAGGGPQSLRVSATHARDLELLLGSRNVGEAESGSGRML